VIGAAIGAAKIAIGEIVESLGQGDEGKDPAAVVLGRKGGSPRGKHVKQEARGIRTQGRQSALAL
jgi:hypothetical protein